MEWIPVYSHDTPETLVTSGYECDNCGYVAHRQWLQCPNCNSVWTGVIAKNATTTINNPTQCALPNAVNALDCVK